MVVERGVLSDPDALVTSEILHYDGAFRVVWRPDVRVPDAMRYGIIKTFGDNAVFRRVAGYPLESLARRDLAHRREV